MLALDDQHSDGGADSCHRPTPLVRHWQNDPPTKVAEFKGGEGLMETLAFHPSGRLFAMGGRLRGGDWNLALFDGASGELLHHRKTGYRITMRPTD